MWIFEKRIEAIAVENACERVGGCQKTLPNPSVPLAITPIP